MIVGIGSDLVDQRRIERAQQRHGPRFAARILGPEEWTGEQPPTANRLAKAWAAKEAVSKALGTGIRGMAMRDIQLQRNGDGQPSVALSGGAARRLQALGGGRVHVSLSDEPPLVLAFAVIDAAAPA